MRYRYLTVAKDGNATVLYAGYTLFNNCHLDNPNLINKETFKLCNVYMYNKIKCRFMYVDASH